MDFSEKYLEWRRNYKYKRDKLTCENLGWGICSALKKNCQMNKLEGLVGYTIAELKKHLIKNLPKGLDWNKDFVNGWLQIDHIVPKRAFVFDKPEDYEFKQCWSLCNLRLVTARENERKGDDITNPTLLGLLISNAKCEAI